MCLPEWKARYYRSHRAVQHWATCCGFQWEPATRYWLCFRPLLLIHRSEPMPNSRYQTPLTSCLTTQSSQEQKTQGRTVCADISEKPGSTTCSRLSWKTMDSNNEWHHNPLIVEELWKPCLSYHRNFLLAAEMSLWAEESPNAEHHTILLKSNTTNFSFAYK